MHALSLKMWREIWQMRGQVIAISLVIVGGIGVGVMSTSTYESLLSSRDSFYSRYNFGDIFAEVKRAPLQVVERIKAIKGINSVEPRVVAYVNIRVPNFTDPVTGLMLSIPDQNQPSLNQLHIVRGRLPDGRRTNEIVISDAFANAHQLEINSKLAAIINGRFKELIVVGIGLSPEYVLQIKPGAVFPDYQRFGVMWMAETPLQRAYDMQGAFNNISVGLEKGANPDVVIEQLDLLLKRYGSLGAYPRKDQLSHSFLQEEFNQLKSMAVIFPVIFLSVALFLLNVVTNRLVQTQREIIAVLKAFGYSNFQVGLHYSAMVVTMVILGIFGGVALGAWLGQGMTVMYTEHYRFPSVIYHLNPQLIIIIMGLVFAAVLLATFTAIKQAVLLPPAEAMRPEPPPQFKRSWVELLGLDRFISQPTKMILRHLNKKPINSLLSVMGIGFACSIMMVGNFQEDSVRFMMLAEFQLSQKQDLDISFVDNIPTKSIRSLSSIQGVNHVEVQRIVPVRLVKEHREFETAILGIGADSKLQHVLDTDHLPLSLPENGLLINKHLAEMLDIEPGEIVQVEVLDGRQQVIKMPVIALAKQYMGMGAYIDRKALNRNLGESNVFNRALLSVNTDYNDEIYTKLQAMPMVASINLRNAIIESFYETLDRVLLAFTLVNTILAGVIAFGVIYNMVRIALSERSRELASLRVLGYSKHEVSYILFGELSILTLAGIPLGFILGTGLCQYMANNLQTEIYRIPLVLTPYAFSYAALVIIMSALLSAVIVGRKIYTMPIVDALKTRE